MVFWNDLRPKESLCAPQGYDRGEETILVDALHNTTQRVYKDMSNQNLFIDKSQ
jgi:hypothetical protein